MNSDAKAAFPITFTPTSKLDEQTNGKQIHLIYIVS
jgi:hypothetical protein